MICTVLKRWNVGSLSVMVVLLVLTMCTAKFFFKFRGFLLRPPFKSQFQVFTIWPQFCHSYSMDTGPLTQGQSGRCVKLTNNLHLVPRLRMIAATSLPSLCVLMTLQDPPCVNSQMLSGDKTPHVMGFINVQLEQQSYYQRLLHAVRS
jgi:hypothetical protein